MPTEMRGKSFLGASNHSEPEKLTWISKHIQDSLATKSSSRKAHHTFLMITTETISLSFKEIIVEIPGNHMSCPASLGPVNVGAGLRH
jgi:hypothetical protein